MLSSCRGAVRLARSCAKWEAAGRPVRFDAPPTCRTPLRRCSTTPREVADPVKQEEEGAKPQIGALGIDTRVYPIAVSSLLMGSGVGVVIPIMPIFASSLGITSAGLGVAIACMGGARLVCNIPASWAADKFGRRPLMILGPLTTASAMALTSLTTSLTELVLWRGMTGVGGCLQMSGSQLYLADISTPENRARTMAPLAAAFSMGMAFGPAVGGMLADNLGLHATFLYVGTAMAMAGINNSFMPETLKKKPSHRPLSAEIAATLQSWKPIVGSRSMRGIMALHASYWAVTSGAMFTLLPLFAVDHFGMSAYEIGKGFSTLACINILGFQPAAWLSDKYGRKAAIVPACAMLATAVGLMPFATSQAHMMALWGLWGVGATVLGSAPTAYVTDIHSDETRGQALALLRSAGDFGLMVGAVLIGTIAKVCGIPAGFLFSASLLAAVGVNFALRCDEVPQLVKKDAKIIK